MKAFVVIQLFLLSYVTYGSVNLEEYYGKKIYSTLSGQQTSKAIIVDAILESSHNQITTINYDQARKIMFGKLFLQTKSNGAPYIQDVYCNREFNKNHGVGANKIPNPKFLNCEHTWPQSKFNKNMPLEVQKADLHHLFPSDMKANSTRNNHPFAEVTGKETHDECSDSKIGYEAQTDLKSFEPPTEHKGNVARAMYYFSTRYKMSIDSMQASYLKKWNQEDPVDAEEISRNDRIMEIQGNRNPFIDFPDLMERI